MTNEPTKVTLGGYEVKSPKTEAQRLSMLLWGSAGCGKTTLAATAPGKKLWINFDPDGIASITDRDDVVFVDLAEAPDSVVEKFKIEDPLGLTKFFKENPDIETVVVDSVTSFGEKALSHGVLKAQGTVKGRSSTIEDPGYAGYGNKNVWTKALTKNLLSLTLKHKKHIIFICHEDKPEKNQDGAVLYITIMLGSSLSESVPLQISEVWALTDTGKDRKIAVRPCRARKPMKSRAFSANKEPEFVWNYNPETKEGDTLELWFNLWKAKGYSKLPFPGTAEYVSLKKKLLPNEKKM